MNRGAPHGRCDETKEIKPVLKPRMKIYLAGEKLEIIRW